MNLQAVSLAKAAPSTDVPASAQSRPNAAKPAARPFNHVLGSLISDEGKASAQANSKKQTPNQESPAGQQPDATVPPAKPIILPALLKFSLLLPASSKATADGSDDRDGDDGDASGTNQMVGVAALQVIPQQVVPTPQPNNSPPQPGIQEAQGLSRLEMFGGELLHSLKPQTPLEPFNSSEIDKQRLAVEAEDGQPLPKAELALSVKITPVASAAPESANTSSINPAPRVNTPPAASPESMPVTATGADQQADANADTDSGQASKQVLKSQSKTQQTVTLPNVEPTPAVSNQYSGDASAQLTVPTAITVVPSVAQSPTKHENNPTTTQPVDARPTVAALPDAAPASKAEPVRDLSIRIGNTAGNQVDVKIQERAGEVHVSVLSSNSALTSDLRQQVGDLVGKLDRAGYHAETFKPTSLTAPPQSSYQSDTGQERDSSGGRQQQQQQQETAQQQFMGRQKRSNQAQWLQQMNGSFGPLATEGIERQ